MGVLIFDGDCGFCTWSVDQLRRWVRPRAQIVAWQVAPLSEMGLTPKTCEVAVQWVADNGEISAGGRAVCALLRSSPQPWPILGVLGSLPVIAPIVDWGYRLIAANRSKLPGATPACVSDRP